MSKDTEDPLNLSSLDPTDDAERFEVLVGNILRDAAPTLEAKRAANNVVAELARWRRPVLTVAAAAAAFLIFSLSGTADQPANVESTSGIAEAIGVPTDLAVWMRGEAEFSVVDIYDGLAEQ